MKNNILNTSAGLVLGGVVLSIGSAIFSSSPETLVRITGVSTTLIVGSIGLFFVGLVYPKEEK